MVVGNRDNKMIMDHHTSSPFEALIEGGPFVVAQFVFIVIAGALQIAWLMRDASRRVNVVALGEQLKKLIAANNPERAVKLCMANSGPSTRLALVGLNARIGGASARDAMREALPQMLREARAGLLPVLAIGVGAVVEGLVLVMEEPDHLALVGGSVALVTVLVMANGVRWGGWQRDLGYIYEVVGKA